MLTDTDLQPLITRIQRQPETQGAPIGFYGGGLCRTLHRGSPVSSSFGTVGVVVEEIPGSFGSSGALGSARTGPARVLRQVPRDLANRSRATSELVNAGVNCSLMAVSAVGVLASGAATPFTGGVSLIGAALSWASLAAGTAACTDSVIRTVEAYDRPGSTSLSHLDRDRGYVAGQQVVAGVGVLAGGASAGRELLAHGTGVLSALSARELATTGGDVLSTAYGAATFPSQARRDLPRLPSSNGNGVSSILIHVFGIDGRSSTVPADRGGRR